MSFVLVLFTIFVVKNW